MAGMNDRQDLETPGELLSAARKRHSLTIDQVAEKTKIPPAMIVAVEADEYFKISDPIYVRSFLRTIAQAVGVDPEQVLALHNRLAGNQGVMTQGETPAWEAEQVVVQRVGVAVRPWMFILVLGLVGVVLGLLLLRGCSGDSSSANGGGIPTAGNNMNPQAAVVAGNDSLGSGEAPDSGESVSTDQVELIACYAPGQAISFVGEGVPLMLLTVRTDHVMSIQVRVDGQRDFAGADWGGAEGGIAVLPQGEVLPGKVYRCSEGFVAFWGAEDHFGLKLGDIQGVVAHLQGQPYSLSGLSAGQEIILDQHSVSD